MKKEIYVCPVCGSATTMTKANEFWRFFCKKCNRTVIGNSILRETNDED